MYAVGRLMKCGTPKLSSSPPVTTNLAFWLDATDPATITLSGNKVTAMADKSGNGFDWAQSNAAHQLTYDATLFGGKGGFVSAFSTGNGLLSNATASTIKQGDFTYFLIGIRTDGILSAIMQDFASGHLYGPAQYNNRWGLNQDSISALQGIPVGVPVVMGFKNTGSAATAYFFDAAGAQYPIFRSDGTIPTGTGTMGNLCIPCKDFGANTGFSMKFAAMLMYNKALADSDIAKICVWIRRKYKIPSPVTINKAINFSGDSITVGFGSDTGTGYAELAMESLGYLGNQFTISAILSQTISQIGTTDATYADPLYNASHAKNILIIMGGTNDIVGGATASQVQTALQTYCQARQAVGWTVLVSTLLPSTNTGFNTVRDAVNIWIRANYHTFANALVDPGGDAVMGPDAAAADTSLYVDGTHPTPLGHSNLAAIFATAIGAIV